MIQSKAVGSAGATAAVRRAPRRTPYPKDTLSGGASGAGMPTASAPLAAPEAGALPEMKIRAMNSRTEGEHPTSNTEVKEDSRCHSMFDVGCSSGLMEHLQEMDVIWGHEPLLVSPLPALPALRGEGGRRPGEGRRRNILPKFSSGLYE